jgi:hypothetical protein
MESIRKELQLDAQPSTFVVDVIPTDSSSPQAAKIVPQSVKRYLQQWLIGDNIGKPIFDNTILHDHKRRATLLSNIPSHVHVSLHHPWLLSGGYSTTYVCRILCPDFCPHFEFYIA